MMSADTVPTPRPLELLAPAADAETAIQAVRHGADAVYIGPPSHGARRNAANSIADIRRVVEFAHTYRARVYVTVNTVIHDHELAGVERMIRDLYRIGVDAIIVQDMAVLRMDIPPIALHASTQCDTRTVGKARFLEEAGFSQIVLARELTLEEISAICGAVTVPVECFVHGALCVSYSGRCHASKATCGRSANRGECAQLCRLPYTLTDAAGNVIARDRHLLSLRDFNLSDRLDTLVAAGVSSFKIEGRLKETGYVKNVTARYSALLDGIVSASGGSLRRSSYGHCEIGFEPRLEKSFNRGFTHYFLDTRRPHGIWQPATPKSMGEPIDDISSLNNGDGISWQDRDGRFQGVMVNGVKDGRIIGARPFHIPNGTRIYRTFDRVFSSRLEKNTADRTLRLDISIDETGITGHDERGVRARVPLDCTRDVARRPMDPQPQLTRLGGTPYSPGGFENRLEPTTFIPASSLAQIRRRLIEALDRDNEATYPYGYRRTENRTYPYPETVLDYRDNVTNALAASFYRDHGVLKIERSLESGNRNIPGTEAPRPSPDGRVVMTTRHCILRETGMCLREHPGAVSLPLTLASGNLRFRLRFDCRRCEMQLLSEH